MIEPADTRYISNVSGAEGDVTPPLRNFDLALKTLHLTQIIGTVPEKIRVVHKPAGAPFLAHGFTS